MGMSTWLSHYGIKTKSGRYPWGSGENPYQRLGNFKSVVTKLKNEGLTEKEIADSQNMSIRQLRANYSIASDGERMAKYIDAVKLKDKGYSNVAIAKRMGINESSVRSLLNPTILERTTSTLTTAKKLQELVDEKKYLDVGSGVENYMGVSRTKVDTALVYLESQGYEVKNFKVKQPATGKDTTMKILCPEGTTYAELYENRDKIGTIETWSNDNGVTWQTIQTPKSVSSDRIQVVYGDEGGSNKDGLIELRRGVDDIALGNSTYAQVRIAVDDSHYLKGMAVYSEDLPEGIDIRFNTSKTKNQIGSDNKLDAMKELKNDPTNPFGASVKQYNYVDSNGKEQLSSINIVNKEGDWSEWSNRLASQVLSKQQPELAKKQLALAYDSQQALYDEISTYTNPVVKQKILYSFADSCDYDAVHLQAAAMPRQSTSVLIPLTNIKSTEIYAPRYNNGERVVLIRYPHAGPYEIPELIVNNKNSEGKRLITNKAVDAVGINSEVAQKLSGADFDGDFVLVIPNNKGSIKTRSSLKDLENFDPKVAYPGYDGMKVMSEATKQNEMGRISNLITDMYLSGADDSEMARAIKHSMVVIDAVKHELNYKQSYIDNGIEQLKEKYQNGGGASTLISLTTSEEHVPDRKESIDPKTGRKIYEETGSQVKYTKKNEDGTVTTYYKPKTIKTTKGAEATDAFTLSSGSKMEAVYAEHANKLKALANTARRDAINMDIPKASPSARQAYAKEVASLTAKLNTALKNAPKERAAVRAANVVIQQKIAANPDLKSDTDKLNKIKAQAIAEARVRVGANKKSVLIDITDREWEAIQAQAISPTTLRKIINNTDETVLKKRASGVGTITMDAARVARAKAMLAAGCTQAEVANALGVSVSTISRAIKE